MGVSQMCVVLAGCWLAQWIVCVFVCWGGGGGGGGLLTELDDIDDDLVCVHRVVEACGWMCV